jgi:3-oxoacyl-[acyl-carrier-protein] synthase II
MRRVVVTGMGGVTPLGEDWPTIRAALRKGRTGVRFIDAWSRFEGINTRLACPVENFTGADHYPRKKLRTMGAVARMATYATERALTVAGLIDDPILRSGRTGIAYGSSFGSPQPYVAFAELMTQGASRKLNATSYIQMMSHTAAVNIGLFFGVTGRTIPTSSACTSGSQAIGYAFESIRGGSPPCQR